MIPLNLIGPWSYAQEPNPLYIIGTMLGLLICSMLFHRVLTFFAIPKSQKETFSKPIYRSLDILQLEKPGLLNNSLEGGIEVIPVGNERKLSIWNKIMILILVITLILVRMDEFLSFDFIYYNTF